MKERDKKMIFSELLKCTIDININSKLIFTTFIALREACRKSISTGAMVAVLMD